MSNYSNLSLLFNGDCPSFHPRLLLRCQKKTNSLDAGDNMEVCQLLLYFLYLTQSLALHLFLGSLCLCCQTRLRVQPHFCECVLSLLQCSDALYLRMRQAEPCNSAAAEADHNQKPAWRAEGFVTVQWEKQEHMTNPVFTDQLFQKLKIEFLYSLQQSFFHWCILRYAY